MVKILVLVMKESVEVLLVPQIAHLVSVFITTGTIPNSFKLTNVHPIHKRKNPVGSASSYRSVSILPALLKVL